MKNNINPKTVLLLEDDAPLNRAIVMKLEQKGNQVISTTRAEEALKVLASEHPFIDIVWLDFLLPGMNGLEFLRELRKNPDNKDLKVVICSVSGNEMSKDTANKLGTLGYIDKSDYNLDTIAEKVMSYA